MRTIENITHAVYNVPGPGKFTLQSIARSTERMLRVPLLSFFALISGSLFGQGNSFPAIIVPSPIEYTLTFRADTFRGDTIFTFKDGYVVNHCNASRGTGLMAFVKAEKGYLVFEACPALDFVPQYYSCDTLNFDGSGQPELVIRWRWSWGHGGRYGGMHSEYAGIFIWNLDQMQLTYEQQNVFHEEWWGVEYERDSLGNENPDSVISSTNSVGCDSWDLDYKLKQITLTWDSSCHPEDEKGNPLPPPERTKYVYILRDSGLVLTE